VKLPASVDGRERARLFCALRLPEETLDTLSDWQADHIDRGRPVPRDHLHITLAFLGHRPVAELEPVCRELREAAAAAGPMRLLPERYRETRSVGMLALSDPQGGAIRLAADLQGRLERLGVYERERPGLRPPLPPLGEVCPSDAAAYHSVLRSGGAQYVVLESFALGG